MRGGVPRRVLDAQLEQRLAQRLVTLALALLAPLEGGVCLVRGWG